MYSVIYEASKIGLKLSDEELELVNTTEHLLVQYQVRWVGRRSFDGAVDDPEPGQLVYCIVSGPKQGPKRSLCIAFGEAQSTHQTILVLAFLEEARLDLDLLALQAHLQ